MSPLETDSRRIRRTSSGSVVLRQINGEWHALLLRAWSHWDFPKGNVESGETLMEAALREVNEETGISNLTFPWGGAFARTAVYSRDKVAYYSIATTTSTEITLAPNPQTGIKEHDEYRWVCWAHVRNLISPRLSCIIDWVESVTKMEPSEGALFKNETPMITTTPEVEHPAHLAEPVAAILAPNTNKEKTVNRKKIPKKGPKR
jgi:8-oxo-dGTP pyrophosphatase MutT (NUDIX family)